MEVGVQRKPESLTMYAFGGTFGMSEEISPTVSFRVGDKSHIRFWHDMCCGEVALKSSFPKFIQ